MQKQLKRLISNLSKDSDVSFLRLIVLKKIIILYFLGLLNIFVATTYFIKGLLNR